MASTEIQTATGKYFDYANMKTETICEEDVALALSKLCRFNGHTTKFYSVAQHLCLVHDLMEGKNEPVLNVFHGLIHDVGEAYLTDIPRPLKNFFLNDSAFTEFMSKYNELELKILNIFCQKYNAGEHSDELQKVVKFYDNWALRLEQRHLMVRTPRTWEVEKNNFPDDPEWIGNFFEWGTEENWAVHFIDRLRTFEDCWIGTV